MVVRLFKDPCPKYGGQVRPRGSRHGPWPLLRYLQTPYLMKHLPPTYLSTLPPVYLPSYPHPLVFPLVYIPLCPYTPDHLPTYVLTHPPT